jgi:Na+/melibiose symporter-like transporter
MGNITHKVPLREKIGYSLGDSSANFVFQLMIIFQLPFYTEAFGITASAAGTILLIARGFDAFVDPIVGILSDRTNTRWGKYRPWVLWTALPFGIFFFLAFTTPDLNERGKLIYAGITYTLLMSIYSFNNTPYSAILGVMSGDIKERTNISTIRFIAAMSAAFIVQGLTLPMVTKFGDGTASSTVGWSRAIGVYSILAIVFFVITFLSVKERIKPPVNQKSSIKQDIKDITKNKPWIAMFVLTLFIFITLAMWGSAMYYYFNYYLEKDAIFSFLQNINLVKEAGTTQGFWHRLLDAFGLIAQEDKSNVFSVGFSFFNMLGMIVQVLGVMLLSQPLAARFGKRNVFIVCLSLTTLLTAVIFFVPSNRVGTMFIINFLRSLAYAPTIPLLWAMMADVADYGEWKYNRRATGFVFAGVVFALKAGLGFGGALCGWIIGAFGYDREKIDNMAEVILDEKVLLGIKLSGSIFPAITFFIGVLALLTYKISKSFNEKIQADLAIRRQKE